MERHIGVWHKELNPEESEVGELLIDGNHIEFNSRFDISPFKETFFGEDGQNNYKVFVEGSNISRLDRLLEYTVSHRVKYVLMGNYSFSKGYEIKGIKEFSFIIPELLKWFGFETVRYGITDQDELAAVEYELPPITIKKDNPKIEIIFESRTFERAFLFEDNYSITVKKEPRINVVFSTLADISIIISEIECIMQFFSLLIGKISYAKDVRLKIYNQESFCRLYINHDFSYNQLTQPIIDSPRTYYYLIEHDIDNYFSHWREFFFDDHYSLLRRIYFAVNNQREKLNEEIFVEYMRFLDGYHTRKYYDAETEINLRKATKKTQKIIKDLINNSDFRNVIESEIKSVIPNWKSKASSIGNIADWIASGYIQRKSLSHRIKELDNKFFLIISNNALIIENLHSSDKLIDLSDEKKIEQYYRELSDTRNYYSHYKQDTSGVLSINQLNYSINVLKATILTILFSHMGMEDNFTRKIIAFDSELSLQTKFLRKKDVPPFLTPKQQLNQLKKELNSNADGTNNNEE